ncbi:Translation factor GUF1-like protein [Abeliophyllum distichum]|uniref:Translation factor GUF1-like protein n=1 Tax=Abeliophyllum distichum TaxID=126358 RepID=A0ABD1RDI0_9LAMI
MSRLTGLLTGPLNTQTSHNTKDEIENQKGDLGQKAFMKYRLPLREIVVDFYNELKSITSGYASFDYDDAELKAQRVGRELVEKLKKFIDRQIFEITIQATIGSKVIARKRKLYNLSTA